MTDCAIREFLAYTFLITTFFNLGCIYVWRRLIKQAKETIKGAEEIMKKYNTFLEDAVEYKNEREKSK